MCKAYYRCEPSLKPEPYPVEPVGNCSGFLHYLGRFHPRNRSTHLTAHQWAQHVLQIHEQMCHCIDPIYDDHFGRVEYLAFLV